MSLTLKWTAVGAVVAGCVGYLAYQTTGTTAAYYRTVAEVRADPSGEARVLGTVDTDVVRTKGGLEVKFTAIDGAYRMPVVFDGTVPDIFRPGIQVVVEGRMGSDGAFHAASLLAKCPSRFTAASPAPG